MMRSDWIVCIGLTAAAALLLAAGFALSAMLLFPVPICFYWLRRKDAQAKALLVCAVLAPTLVAGALTGLIFGLIAMHGLLLGMLARRGVSLGAAVTILSCLLFVFLATHSALAWDVVRDNWQAALQTQLEKSMVDDGDTMNPQATAMFEWFQEHLVYLYFGMLLGGIILMMTALAAPIYWKFGNEGAIAPTNFRFMQMRVPEYLVLLAIALALLWFFENRWPSEALRFVVWNSALALATVYWINGISIVIYLFHVFRYPPVVPYVVLALLFVAGIFFVLSVIGFFDTWISFREKALLAAEARTGKGDDNAPKD